MSDTNLNKHEALEADKIEFEQNKLKFEKLKLSFTKAMLFGFILLQIGIFTFIGYKIYFLLNPVNNTGAHIAVINIDQPITEDYSDKITTKIAEIRKDIQLKHNIKGVVIKLRSPGGSPSASWTIATELKKLSKDLPLYTYVDSAAVSGSYMIASQSSKIYANQFAMVGSIGVILEHFVLKDLSEKVGVGQETLTAGKYKKMISTFKYLNEEDKKYLEDNLLNEIYASFINVVANGRNISKENLMDFAEGKVFMASDKRVQGVLIDSVIDWTDMKELIISELNVDKNIEFNIYSLEDKSNLLKLITTSLGFKLSNEITSPLSLK